MSFIRFTLIELLVVIAIISILMSILLPSLKKVRGRTKAIACTSNMRQIGIGVSSYSIDNNSYAPSDPTWKSAFSNYWSKWPILSASSNGYVYPFARLMIEAKYVDVSLLQCPAAPGHVGRFSTGYTWDLKQYKKSGLYPYASYLLTPSQLGNNLAVGGAARYTAVNELYTAKEYPRIGWKLGRYPYQAMCSDMVFSGDNTFTHKNGVNVLYQDGAVTWMPGFPQYALVYYSSYSLSNASSKFKYFIRMSRDSNGFPGYPLP